MTITGSNKGRTSGMGHIILNVDRSQPICGNCKRSYTVPRVKFGKKYCPYCGKPL